MQTATCQQTWIDGLNRGDVSVADKVFAQDGVIHINGSPVEDQVAAADKVATRWVAEGTNSGPFGPVPPTGRRVRVDGLILDRVADGKIVERWEQWDQAGMMQQLGLA